MGNARWVLEVLAEPSRLFCMAILELLKDPCLSSALRRSSVLSLLRVSS